MEAPIPSGPIHCDEALTEVFGLLGKRWSGMVVGVLLERPARFGEIKGLISPCEFRFRWGPDRRRWGPHHDAHFRRIIRVLAQI